MKSKEDLVKTANRLLESAWPCEATRLLALRLSNLVDKNEFNKSHGKIKLITEFTKVMDKSELFKVKKESPVKVKKRELELEAPSKSRRRKTKKVSDYIIKLDQFLQKKD